MPSRVTVLLVFLLMITPALIYCAWLLILPLRVAFLCPEGCWCDAGGYRIHCSNSSLHNIPTTFLQYVRIVRLKYINLTSLQKDIFLRSRIAQLETLSADNCGLERVEPGVFNGLISLTELSVTNNTIREIKPRTFENLIYLKELSLADNQIENLDPEAFFGLSNLQYIYLDTNKIQYLPPDLFLNVSNLLYLGLGNNPLLKIPTDHHFIYSISLTYLDISNCNISSISVETFSNVTGLNEIDLSENHLKNTDVNILKILPQLSKFLIYKNPLSCDCQLQQVWRWCQNRSIKTGDRYEGPECDSPSEVDGMWWGTLQHSQCFDDRIAYHEGYNSVHYKYIDIANKKYLELHHFITYVQTSVYAVLFIFGTLGNVMVLVIIACNNEMRTVPNMYIINLAISDLITLITILPLSQAQLMSDTWQYGEFLCKFFEFSCALSVGLSAYFVALLSYQRYKVTVDPLRVLVCSPVTWRVTAATICGVWIVAAIFALPSALSVEESTYEYCYVYLKQIYYKKVVLFELYVFCILPLCVIVFFYVMTARHLVKSAHTISEEIHPLASRRKNTARIVLGLSIVFVISYLPYNIIWVYLTFNGFTGDMELEYIYFISTWLLVLNSCLNPVALFCSSLAFRMEFKRCLMCFKRRRVVTTTLELTEST